MGGPKDPVAKSAYRKRYYQEHRDKELLRAVAYYHANKEDYQAKARAHPEKGRERMRNWRAQPENRDQENGLKRVRYAKEPERHRAHAKKHRQSDFGKANIRVRNANRDARRKGAAGTFTRNDVEMLLEMQDAYCLCGKDISDNIFHVDHKTPLIRGGSNWPENLQLLCPPCNIRKHDKTMDEWSPTKGVVK